MIEAEQIRQRPWAYFFLRRFELTRWTLTTKLHREAKWYALPLSLWLAITGYETERCCFCGWKVYTVWYCDDQILWETVTGYENGGGVSCADCFSERAYAKNLPVKWTVGPLCGYTNEEWLRIVAANEKAQKESRDVEM